ncbi:MAG: hypothetical protein HY961_18200 [Ignavibacteriae bacterium]|nr:hypothetical protein [Ignavibacteriota bacterium]
MPRRDKLIIQYGKDVFSEKKSGVQKIRIQSPALRTVGIAVRKSIMQTLTDDVQTESGQMLLRPPAGIERTTSSGEYSSEPLDLTPPRLNAKEDTVTLPRTTICSEILFTLRVTHDSFLAGY